MSMGRLARSSVAIVTGAGRGIGRSVALRLAADGYSLVLGDLPSSQEALSAVRRECASIYRTLPSRVSRESMQMVCDVSDEAQVNSLVDTAVSEFGGLEVMVANAGIAKTGPLADISTEDIDKHLAVNVKGVFYSYRAAARVMIPAGYGRIIGACSTAAKITPPGFGAYCMSKAAIRSLTHSGAQEWGPYGLTVNAYAPGPIDTGMWRQDIMGGAEEHPIDAQLMLMTPTAKKTTTEQVAGIVSFLASSAADNINGQCISINGGIQMD
ncbi:putative short chain dehydrogenase [Ceratobasidium sp. AG-I]|nr:putative short chain dehydrogenase [Ceratobasidium sp. AG-I]